MTYPAIIATPSKDLRRVTMLAHRFCYQAKARPFSLGVALHATDGHEGPADAEACARLFQNPTNKRSSHVVVDSNSAVTCVPLDQIAWHARRTANGRYQGVEICGRVRQTTDDWYDDISYKTLCNAARVVADLCRAGLYPVRQLTPTEMRAQFSGIVTHLDISNAWHESNHTDPGPGFPMAAFLEAVRKAVLS